MSSNSEQNKKSQFSLADISIRNPVMTWMILAAIILFGLITFRKLGISQLPDVDFPQVNVSITYEGASPEVVESMIIDPVEDALISVEGVKSMSSTARTGQASISLEFSISKNIEEAVQEVNTKLLQAQRRLPDSIEPPIVSKTNPEDQPIMWLSVKAEKMNMKELVTFVRNQIQDRFLTVEGVSDIFLGGYVEPSLRIWVSLAKLDEYAFTVQDLINTVQTESNETPAGRIDIGDKQWNVRTIGEIRNADELKKLIIQKRGGSPSFVPIPMGKVVDAEDGLQDVVRLSRTDGVFAVGLGIRKQRGSNAVQVAKDVKATLAEIKKTLPTGVAMGVNFDSTEFIEHSVNELQMHLILAAILTAFVCFLFFGTFSSTFNVIIAIPVSIMGTFFVFERLGFTLNTFTLLGLTLAIGIVVDDAIMVLENIIRHKQMGKSAVRAARDGATEITFAAIAATLAIVAIFLPVAFMDGVIGQYFLQFGITISVAVLFSLFEAITLAPMRSAQFISDKVPTHFLYRWTEATLEKLRRWYGGALEVCISHKWLVIGVSVAIFGASLMVIPGLRKEMVPSQDQSSLSMRITTPEGSSLQYTDSKTKEVEALLKSMPEVKQFFVSIGGWNGEATNANAFITLHPKNERKPISDIMDELRQKSKTIKGARIMIQDPSLQSFGSRRSFPIDFNIKGPNLKTLGEIAQKMIADLESANVAVDLDTNYKPENPEIHIFPNREAAIRRGVSVEDLSDTIRALVGGIEIGNVSQDGRRNEIRLRLRVEDRADLNNLKKIRIRNNRGELIPLGELASIEERSSVLAIYREDRSRSVGVYGNLVKGQSQAAALEKVETYGKTLPVGYSIVTGGSSKVFRESFQSLYFALILGLIVAYMILASQFNSYLDPAIILMALPFSLTGALLALWAADLSINVFSLIGILLLMGIVKKNSILLVEFANHKMEEGLSAIEAIKMAGPTRLRPILMTSIATIAAAIPQALGLGQGAETRQPMALAVVGGVLVSTLMTFFVVPSMYVAFKKTANRPRLDLD